MSPERVGEYLRERCGEDGEMIRAVERMLSEEGQTEVLPPRAKLGLGPGAVVAGRFEIVRFLGRGGMGEVYEARDAELSGTVALKLIRAVRLQNESAEGRFRREVQLARQVTHSNICRVFDVGHDGTLTFLTMEFLDGETLADRLKREGAMTNEQALPLLRQMAAGLDALHERGIVHRDFKPGNVMLTRDGRAVITDFGLARTMEGGEKYTQTGAMLGTPAYMAPEQLAGEAATAASDIYAFGAVMREMRPDWAGAARRCLEWDPKARPNTAGEAIAGLDAPGGIDRRWWIGTAAAVVVGTGGYWAMRGRAVPGMSPDYLVKARDLLQRNYRLENVTAAMKQLEGRPESAVGQALLAKGYKLQAVEVNDAKLMGLAEAAARRAIELDKDLDSPHVTLAEIHLLAGRTDLANAEIREALRIDARSSEAYRALGEVQKGQGRMAEAEASFVKAVDLDPESWTPRSALALHYQSQGKYALGLEQLQAALRAAPDSAALYINLGNAYFRMDRYGDARKAYEASLRLERRHRALANLGSAYMLEGEYGRAAGMFEESLAMQSANYLAWGNLGAAYTWGQLGKDKATQAYRKAIEQGEERRRLTPKDPILLARMSGYYAVLGEPKQAEGLIRQAIALKPDSNDVAAIAAETYELMGKRDEALRWLETALRLGFSINYIRRSPELASLRADPRYAKLEAQNQ